MAQWHPISNLRSQFTHHPPVVVFFICLLVLSGTFISIGLYSQNHDIRNPDVNLDWNQMLGSLARLKFCTQLKNTELSYSKQEMDSLPLLDHSDGFTANTSKKTMGVMHMFLRVRLVCSRDDQNQNSMSATLLGSQLGLKGAAGKESINISLFLNVQKQSLNVDSKTPTNTEPKPSSPVSCLMISAPANILPKTQSPPECPSNENLEKDTPVKALAIEKYKQSFQKELPCLSLEFTPDPKLTVVLTQEERALARYHLMAFSTVVLVICSIMCLIGSLTCLRSHRHHASDLQKETLLMS